ncbi:MAG: HAD family hydrolase [Clostridia bacterium]|nr:HAD family hydrolase [Clostridia bacterium]
MKIIKRICFDLDNTLIPWSDNNYKSIRPVFKNLGLHCDNDTISKFVSALQDYITTCDIFTASGITTHINMNLNINLNDDFISMWSEELAKCIPKKISPAVSLALEELAEKYELYVLTDWFKESQEKRLINSGLIKYFSKVCGIDNIKTKPSFESYNQLLIDVKPQNCVMIGDSLNKDVLGAANHGIFGILYDPQYKNQDYPYAFGNFNELPELIEQIEEMLYIKNKIVC